MLSANRASQCSRLVDYVLLVGNRTPSRKQGSETPELLRCFPNKPHSDFAVPPDIVYFCQPEGCISTTRKQLNATSANEEFFVFALTDKDSGKVRYGVCVNFFRAIEREPNAKRVGARREETDCAVKCVGRSWDSDSESESESEVNEARHRAQVCTRTLTSLCIVTHHCFFSAFHQTLLRLRKLIESRRLNRIAQLGRAGDAALWQAVIGVDEQWHTLVAHDVLEIERWIGRLLSAPVPVPGCTVLEVSAKLVRLAVSRLERQFNSAGVSNTCR